LVIAYHVKFRIAGGGVSPPPCRTTLPKEPSAQASTIRTAFKVFCRRERPNAARSASLATMARSDVVWDLATEVVVENAPRHAGAEGPRQAGEPTALGELAKRVSYLCTGRL
jgi:hypothetical protein